MKSAGFMALFLTAFLFVEGGLAQADILESFEEPGAMGRLRLGHRASPANAKEIDLDGNMQPGHGNGGLQLLPTSAAPHLSLTLPETFTRDELDSRGAALLQVDFFLPDADQPVPNISVMATPKGGSAYAMYRAGFDKRGSIFYFSYSDGVTPGPILFQTQPAMELPIHKPGWNRLQLLLNDDDTIVAGMNGQSASFCPLFEGTLDNLLGGVMVSHTDILQPVVLDNLALLFTDEDELPEADTAYAVTPRPVESTPREISAPPPRQAKPEISLIDTNGPLYWHDDPEAAWAETQRRATKCLILFTDSSSSGHEHLRMTIPGNAITRREFERFALLKLDVSDAIGKRNAQKFGVSKLPSFVVLARDGSERGRLKVDAQVTTWNEIQDFLSRYFD